LRFIGKCYDLEVYFSQNDFNLDSFLRTSVSFVNLYLGDELEKLYGEGFLVQKIRTRNLKFSYHL
jgi:hypothetical protein